MKLSVIVNKIKTNEDCGMGNCASSLIQGIHIIIMMEKILICNRIVHWDIGGYSPSDIDVICSF